MAQRTNTKFNTPLIVIKRNGKHHSNFFEWKAEQDRILSLRNTGIKAEHIDKTTRPKGNRIELKLDDVSLLHVKILRDLGIKKVWTDNDFIIDDKR